MTKEVIPDTRDASLRQLLARITGKTKVTDHRKTDIGSPVLQVLHSEGIVTIDHQETTEEGIRLQGSIDLTVLCITENDETPYVSTREQIPYEYTLNVQGVTGTDQAEVHSELEQLQVNLLVEEQEIDSNVLAGLPSAVIYIAAPGDDLWSIGRKYHMPVKTVRELNALESDELRPGQKVLLVKGLA